MARPACRVSLTFCSGRLYLAGTKCQAPEDATPNRPGKRRAASCAPNHQTKTETDKPHREALFFLIVSHLLTLSSSLTSHLHTLQLLCPSLPVCPPRNPIRHIATLFAIALDPPEVDLALLQGLADAEETLRQGSKSFEVAKLAFGREMRIGLVAVYAWCRVTVCGLSFWCRGRGASTEGEDSRNVKWVWNKSGKH
jgi:hypothetical protein